MLNKNASRTAIAVLSVLAMTACGGSGGGENGNGGGNVPAPTITVTNSNIDIQEAGDTTISFTLNDVGDSAIVSATSNNGMLKVDVENKTQLRMEAPAVDNDTPVTVSLEVKYGGQRSTTSIEVNIINTSVSTVYEKIDAFADLLTNGYQDERQLFDYASQVGYLSGVVSRSEIKMFDELFTESLESVSGEVAIGDAINTLLDSYSDSTISESELTTGIDALVQKYNDALIQPNNIINDLLGSVGMQFPNLKLSGFIYHPEIKQFSQLLSDTVGSFGDGFQFSEDYVFLEDILPSMNSNQQCLTTEGS
tara:strand:- start:19516 stop:20439 length:924 start_codon:yes stop_codon:yes gene_type:complete